MQILKSKWTAVVLAVILAVIALYAARVKSVESRVERELKHLTNKEKPVSLKSIVPKKQEPGGGNSARYYRAAMALVYISRDKADYQRNEMPRYYLQYREEIQGEIDDNRMVFELLKKADEKPGCRFVMDYHRGFDMDFPDLAAYRKLGTLLSFKAIRDVENNRPGEAVQTLRQGVRMVRDFSRGTAYSNGGLPALSLVWCLANLEMLADPMEMMTDREIKTDYSGLINEIDSYLDESKDRFNDHLETHRLMGLQLFDRFMKSKDLAVDADNLMLQQRGTDSITRAKYRHRLKETLLSDKLFFLKHMRKVADAAHRKNEEEMEALDKEARREGRKHFISNGIIFNAAGIFRQYNKTRNRLKQLRDRMEKLSIRV